MSMGINLLGDGDSREYTKYSSVPLLEKALVNQTKACYWNKLDGHKYKALSILRHYVFGAGSVPMSCDLKKEKTWLYSAFN